MEIKDEIIQQIQDTNAPTVKVSSNDIATFLDRNGWAKSIAGDADFDKIVRAIEMAHNNNRGVLVAGDAGCGKSHLFKTLMKNYKGNLFLYCKNMDDLKFMRMREIDGDVRNIFIDDLGCEEIVREYGNVIDVVGDFIQFLYDRFNGRVFINTNLTSKEINVKYGGRILDRILERCVCVRMDGKSKRKMMVVQ